MKKDNNNQNKIPARPVMPTADPLWRTGGSNGVSQAPVPTEASGEFLTVQQTAKEVQVTTKTVWHWIKIRELPAEKLGRIYRIKKADLETFIICHKVYRGFIEVEPSFYRLAVLDKYRPVKRAVGSHRNDPAKSACVPKIGTDRYYLHEQTYGGKLGIRAPRHWLHSGRKPRLRINKSDFCEIYFNKVPLDTGEIVVRLMYQESDKLQCQKEEPIHWSNFVIQNPALGTKFGGK